MSIFYTGKGDGGESLLWDNKKIDKASEEVELLGSLDELNSIIGIIRSTSNKDLASLLLEIQQNIFSIQANIFYIIIDREKEAPKFDEQKTSDLEKEIAEIEKVCPPQKKFIIPGESPASAWLDLARTNARKVERAAFVFNKTKKIPTNILSYLNRLSSLFFAMARREAEIEGIKEQNPKY